MKTEQNDPQGQVLKSVKSDLQTGVTHVISVYRPPVVIDCHMHIQSGNCATLPFLWKKTGPLKVVHPGRKTIVSLGRAEEFLIDHFHVFSSTEGEGGQNATDLQKELYRRHKLRDTIEVAKNNTYEIGVYFVEEKMENVQAFLHKDPFYEGVSQLSFSCVLLTMDMEYAHLDGYYGIKICNAIYEKDDPEKKPVDYWYPLHPVLFKDDRAGEKTYAEREDHPLSLLDDQPKDEFDKNKPLMKEHGIPGVYYDGAGNPTKISVKAGIKLLGKEETELYEQWKKQVDNTELAVLAKPLRLLPLFHYDPRRWQTQGNTGNNYPFAQVGLSGLYLGFKMYTAQGYRPWDPRMPILKDFYRRCCIENIPIVNHCTPGGAPTFDLERYIDFRHPLDTMKDDEQKKTSLDRIGYFNRHFVSPEAWRDVLDQQVGGTRLKDLRLCLAHFGGNDEQGHQWGVDILQMMRDFPNVYADISYSFVYKGFRDYFRDKICKSEGFEQKIRHRILFGSDWYLTKLEGVDYEEYCKTAKGFLDGFDTSLWFRFTQINPYAFYRLDWRIKHIAENIIEKRNDANNKEVRKSLKELTPGQIDDIRKEAAWIEAAIGPYTNYEET
jgi:predicted TIM-barrel fold metal-dependent hydrolase